MQGKGAMQKGEGKLQGIAGDAKDKARDLRDRV